jgi:methylglutaconyl-CoA hydratase
MTVNCTAFYSADWAHSKGLYAEIFPTVEEMDAAISALLPTLTSYNPEAMRMLKQVFWEGTEHWDSLLLERAGMSGTLVLSEFTRNAIQKFKGK